MRNRVTIILAMACVCAGCQSHQTGAVKKQYNASTVKVYLPLAQEQYARGEYDSAVDSATKVVESAPQMPQAHTILGKALLALDRKTEAAIQFTTATGLDPSCCDSWYGLAVLADDSKDRPAAIGHLEKAVACPDASVEAVTYLADMYVSMNEGDKALNLLEEKCRAMGGEPAVMKAAAAANLRMGRADRAVILYEGLCQSSPKDKQLMEMLGYAYIEAGRQSDAAELFARLADKSPATATGYVMLAAGCYLRQGKYDSAITLCDRYASLCKDDAAFWMVMSRAALGKKDAWRAVYAAKRAITIDPSSSEARILMGCAQYTDGRYADAIETLAVLSSDASSFVYVMRGQCYSRLGDKDAAMKAFEQALKLDPENIAASRHMRELALGTTPVTEPTSVNAAAK